MIETEAGRSEARDYGIKLVAKTTAQFLIGRIPFSRHIENATASIGKKLGITGDATQGVMDKFLSGGGKEVGTKKLAQASQRVVFKKERQCLE